MSGQGRGGARAWLRAGAVALALTVAAGCGGADAGDGGAVRGDAGSDAVVAEALRAGDGVVDLTGTVQQVVDGDTVRVRVRDQDVVVRLVGIDTPEVRHPQRGEECFGPEASARAGGLMPRGATVRLRSDPTQDVRDRFGRLLAHVYNGGATGADSVNRRLVAEGMARVYVYDRVPFTHVAAFQRAEQRARQEREGLWGPPCNGGAERPTGAPATVPAAALDDPGACDPGYVGACVPFYPPDVQCDDVRRRVQVIGHDPHRLDGDGNGFGCERFG